MYVCTCNYVRNNKKQRYGTGIFAVRVPATGLLVTPLITTYQDTAERSAGTLWYNGNGRRVVMVEALVWILTAVVFLPFFLTKLKLEECKTLWGELDDALQNQSCPMN